MSSNIVLSITGFAMLDKVKRVFKSTYDRDSETIAHSREMPNEQALNFLSKASLKNFGTATLTVMAEGGVYLGFKLFQYATFSIPASPLGGQTVPQAPPLVIWPYIVGGAVGARLALAAVKYTVRGISDRKELRRRSEEEVK